MKKCLFSLVFLLTYLYIHAQQWTPYSFGASRDINALYIQNPNDIFLAGGHIYNDSIQSLYNGNGLYWSYLIDTARGRGMLLDIDFPDSLHGYACGYNGNVVISSNGGQSWTLSPTPITGRNYRKLAFTSPTVGYAVGANYNDSVQTIIKTTDGGNTWSTLIDQPGPGLNAVAFINADTGFAVGDMGAFLTTVNGGTTWASVTPPDTFNFSGIRFINSSTGYVVGGNDSTRVILNTIDGGSTWSVLKNEKGSQLTDIFFYHNNGYIVGTNSALLLSTDGGQTWAYDTVSLFGDTTHLTSVRFYNDSFGVIGGTLGNLFIYSASAAPSVYTLSSLLLDSADASISVAVNTHGDAGQYYVYYTLDSTWSTYFYTGPFLITCDSLALLNQSLNGLTPDRYYYYFASATTIGGTASGDTLKLYTGIPYTTFSTQPATNVGSHTATLNGVVDKFSLPVTLYFDYGTSPALGTTVAATPSSISDTLFHTVSVTLSGLQSGIIYYYRLRGHTATGDQIGGINLVYTGSVYTSLSTMAATYVSDTGATLNGIIDGFAFPVTLTFQYGTTPAFGNTMTNIGPSQVTDTGFYSISGMLTHSDLLPYTLYFYRLVAQTSIGTYYANTMTFFTSGDLSTSFTTLQATHVTTASADLNGSVYHFPTPVSLSFEYGMTPSFGDTIVSIPAMVNDTNYHSVTAALTGLNPNTVYYYRLKGTYIGGTVYGATKYLYTGASDIPNWDFQVWYTDTVTLPYDWRTITNQVARVPGHTGLYAAKVFGPTGLILGSIHNAGENTGPTFYGGAPLHARPDSLIAYMNYDVIPGDSAAVLFYLYSGDTILASGFDFLTGNSGGGWARVAFPIPYISPTGIADSIILGFTSVNPLANPGNSSSSNSVIVDDVSFSPPAPAPLPNAGFENWFNYSSAHLVDWYSLDYLGFDYAAMTSYPCVTQAYFSPPNDLAAEVHNIPVAGKILGGFMTSQSNPLFDATAPSFPVVINHQTLNGFFKFYPVNGDTFRIEVDMYKNGHTIGNGLFLQTDTVDTFTPFQVDISYQSASIPDSATIKVAPFFNNAWGTSWAVVDKFNFDNTLILGEADIAAYQSKDKILAYPNPASSRLTVEMPGPSCNTDITLEDLNGRLVRSLSDINIESKVQIDVSDVSCGMYILRVNTGSETQIKKIIVSR